MGTCTNCKTPLDRSNAYRKGDRLSSRCKSCFNQYCAERWTLRKIEAIKKFGDCCFDCKQSYSYPVYDFHHLDPREKDLDWNKMRLVTQETLDAELAKCVLLCSNCHRERHFKQRPEKQPLIRPVPRVWEHGTRNGYTYHKCRCEPCKKANNEHSKRYRKKEAT